MSFDVLEKDASAALDGVSSAPAATTDSIARMRVRRPGGARYVSRRSTSLPAWRDSAQFISAYLPLQQRHLALRQCPKWKAAGPQAGRALTTGGGCPCPTLPGKQGRFRRPFRDQHRAPLSRHYGEYPGVKQHSDDVDQESPRSIPGELVPGLMFLMKSVSEDQYFAMIGPPQLNR
jgi:hypothetical protein